MTLALAAHAADNSETEGSITDAKQECSAEDDIYLRDRTSPRVSSAAGIAKNKSHPLQEGPANRRRALSPRKTVGVGGNSTAFGANAAPCQGASTAPTAAAAAVTAGGVKGRERGSPEAGRGHGGDDANSGPVEEERKAPAEEERKAAKIRAQMSVLMVGLFEIIRQVKARNAEVFVGENTSRWGCAVPRRLLRGFFPETSTPFTQRHAFFDILHSLARPIGSFSSPSRLSVLPMAGIIALPPSTSPVLHRVLFAETHVRPAHRRGFTPHRKQI